MLVETGASSKMISKYDALPHLEKIIIQILAINVDYCRVFAMIGCLNTLGLTDANGRKFTTPSLKPITQGLIYKQLLLRSGKGMLCPESLQQYAMRMALREETFASIAKAIKENITLPPTNIEKSLFENYAQIIRSFHISLFSSDSLVELQNISHYYAFNYFREKYYTDNPFLRTLNKPFAPDIIDKIPPESRAAVLRSLLLMTGTTLEPFHEIVQYISSEYQSSSLDSNAPLALLSHYMLCGETSQAPLLLEKLPVELKVEQYGHKGCFAFISGNYEEALGHFNTAVTCIKKKTRKRHVFLNAYFGIFHLFTLLYHGDTAHLQEALGYIGTARKERDNLLPIIEILATIIQEHLGQTTDLEIPDTSIYEHEPLNMLLMNLVLFWGDKPSVKKTISEIVRTRNKALRNDYTWLAAELSAFLALVGHSKIKNQELATKLHENCHTVSFVTMIKHQPRWEKALNGLLHITGQKDSEKKPTEQRLIWLFDHSSAYNICTITPRLQKINKSGSWSKGRPVALKNLSKNFSIMEGLTEQDRLVSQTIKEEYFSSSWHYGKTVYKFDKNRALPALAGHPLIFLEKSIGVQVELVAAEPEMRLEKKNGKVTITVSPTPPADNRKVLVIKDTPTRYKVIRFRKEHNAIIGFVKEGLIIPEAGEKLAQQVAESLSSLLPIHSDLETSQTTKSIPADHRPHAHIIPYQAGIKLEFLIKPCGDSGSSFHPGKGAKNVLTEIDGERIKAVRNFKKEMTQHRKIIAACPTLEHVEELDHQWLIDDPEESLELLLSLKECGDNVALEWPQGEKMKVHREISSGNFSMQIKKDRDWFKATGTLEVDENLSLDLRQLLEMLTKSTGRFIPLDDGTFLAITKQLRNRLNELSAYSDGHGKGVRFSPFAAMALEDLTEDIGDLKSDRAWKEHCRQINEVIQPAVPSTLQASLRDYQTTGFKWLAQLSHWGMGACLADDMGLGKTIQAMAAILLKAGEGPSLVLAPLSVTSNWQEEAARFAPTLNVIPFGIGDRQKTIQKLKPFDLLIVSYGLLPTEAELLASVEWQTIVLDEAQAIKNMQTQRSKAAMALQAQFRIITTGTPIENHLAELWTLFHFLNPGLLGSFKGFNEKFATPIERDNDNEARSRLRKLIRPFILRRLKSDVLQELPAKTEINLEVEMSPEELLLYEAQRLKALENIDAHDEDGAGQKHLRILAEIMKLRRLCCNPSLVLPDCKIASSKLKVFSDILTELLDNNHKALIFSQFVDHLKIIRAHLDRKKISYQYLDGSTPIKKRKERVNNFQNGEGDVFLISLKAGGAGLNLTAADYVIHMDPWWNPAVEDQASDRAHRIGQDRPVTVYRLVVKNSIEEQIVELHKQKRDLANSLLEGTDTAGTISAKDLLNLLHQEK